MHVERIKSIAITRRGIYVPLSKIASGILFNPKTVKSQIQGGIYSVKFKIGHEVHKANSWSRIDITFLKLIYGGSE